MRHERAPGQGARTPAASGTDFQIVGRHRVGRRSRRRASSISRSRGIREAGTGALRHGQLRRSRGAPSWSPRPGTTGNGGSDLSGGLSRRRRRLGDRHDTANFASFSSFGPWVSLAAPGIQHHSRRATTTRLGAESGTSLRVADGRRLLRRSSWRNIPTGARRQIASAARRRPRTDRGPRQASTRTTATVCSTPTAALGGPRSPPCFRRPGRVRAERLLDADDVAHHVGEWNDRSRKATSTWYGTRARSARRARVPRRRSGLRPARRPELQPCAEGLRPRPPPDRDAGRHRVRGRRASDRASARRGTLLSSACRTRAGSQSSRQLLGDPHEASRPRVTTVSRRRGRSRRRPARGGAPTMKSIASSAPSLRICSGVPG